MKLYATVQSERATKGQGGEFLNIVITDRNKNELARLVVTEEEQGFVIAYDYDEDSTVCERWHDLEFATEHLGQKGKKQKGEPNFTGRPKNCECDNTHEENGTCCRFCWDKGFRKVPQ